MTTWTLGFVTVTRIEEQLGITNQPCEKYFPNFEREVLRRHLDWAAPDHYSARQDRFVTSVHSWLIRAGGLTILIDTCGGNHKNRPWTHRFHQLNTPYLARLRAAGAEPEDIDLVLCTHLHADHVGWNTMLQDGRWVPTFPNAKYLFSRTDDAYWDKRKNPSMAADPRHMAYDDSVLPVVQSGQVVLVDDGYEVTSKITVEAAPGHSPGHVLFRLKDDGARAVFCGDIIHHALQIYAPHWTHMADEWPADGVSSRRRVLESCAEQGAHLFPIHFGAPHVALIEDGPRGFSHRAMAQSYPNHPIKIVVSSAAGGPLDIVARAVAEKLTGSLKQPVVVEERTGAGGNIAADYVSNAAPDGYTLLFTLSTTLTVNPHLYNNLTFNLKPITVVNYSTQTLFVHPSLPVKDLADFVAWAKKNGPVTYAHGGVGTSSHLAMEYFRWRAGFDTSPVPYRGASAMVADLIAGQVKVSFGSTAGLLPLAKAGKLRALAVSTSQRSPLAPEIPTIAESGYPGFEVTTDFVLMAPGGTPDDIVNLLQGGVRRAIDTPEFKDRFSKQDIWIVGSTPAETAARIAAGNNVWSKVVKQTGMKAK